MIVCQSIWAVYLTDYAHKATHYNHVNKLPLVNQITGSIFPATAAIYMHTLVFLGELWCMTVWKKKQFALQFTRTVTHQSLYKWLNHIWQYQILYSVRYGQTTCSQSQDTSPISISTLLTRSGKAQVYRQHSNFIKRRVRANQVTTHSLTHYFSSDSASASVKS